jgi:hypothetical protein
MWKIRVRFAFKQELTEWDRYEEEQHNQKYTSSYNAESLRS